MMEFTLSRVAMIACGVILLGAVFTPMSSVYDDMEDREIRGSADKIAVMFDRFWDSKADVMTVRGWDIIPTSEYGIQIDGHNVVLVKGDKSYRALMTHAAGQVTITHGDIYDIVRDDGKLVFSRQ